MTKDELTTLLDAHAQASRRYGRWMVACGCCVGLALPPTVCWALWPVYLRTALPLVWMAAVAASWRWSKASLARERAFDRMRGRGSLHVLTDDASEVADLDGKIIPFPGTGARGPPGGQ